jgi:phosphoribosylformylglycinamidine synthase PurS subunit
MEGAASANWTDSSCGELSAPILGTRRRVSLQSIKAAGSRFYFSDSANMKVKVLVTPKAAVLDPQGAAVRDAMQHLGMPEVRDVRVGKYLEIEIDGKDGDLEKRLHGLCRDLLSNPVIEDYELIPAQK